MGDNTKSCLAFVAVVAISCLIAWIGGYNFDQRGEGVAVGALLMLGLASFAALLARDNW